MGPVHPKAEASGRHQRPVTKSMRQAAKALADVAETYLRTLPLAERERRLRKLQEVVAEIIERKRGH